MSFQGFLLTGAEEEKKCTAKGFPKTNERPNAKNNTKAFVPTPTSQKKMGYDSENYLKAIFGTFLNLFSIYFLLENGLPLRKLFHIDAGMF